MLDELERWYLAQCNGDWEHQYGISIGTLDNPGWLLRVDLRGTPLEGMPFTRVRDMDPQEAWINCKVEDGVFEAACGPLMLSAAINCFLTWASSKT